jgi:ATP-dependent DNA helicase RecG
MIHDSILPDILVHATLSIVKINNKDVLKIVVSRGSRRPYYLKKKGLKSSGVFIRYGTSVSEASEDNIRQMIIESDGTSFESMRAMNQALTFNQTTDYFEAHHVSFTKENMQSLGLITSDIIYTNLGLLLSDQCEHTIKCARYRGEDKLDFQDRKEFSGSVLS